MYSGFWWGKPEGNSHLKGIGIDRRIIVKLILKNVVGRAWVGLLWLRIQPTGELL